MALVESPCGLHGHPTAAHFNRPVLSNRPSHPESMSEPVLAVVTAVFPRQVQLYTDGGKWIHRSIICVVRLQPRFMSLAQLAQITPFLPSGPVSAAQLDRLQYVSLDVPRHAGSGIVTQLAAFQTALESAQRRNAAVLERLHSVVARPDSSWIADVSTIASLALDLPVTQLSSPQLVAVRRAITTARIGFVAHERRRDGRELFTVQSARDVDAIRRVRVWLRAFQERQIRVTCRGAERSETAEAECEISRFVAKARQLVEQSRTLRLTTAMGSVGPLLGDSADGPGAAEPNQTLRVDSSVPSPPSSSPAIISSTAFSPSDRDVLAFMWSRAVAGSLLYDLASMSLQSYLLHTVGTYDGMLRAAPTVYTFLQELGVVAPHENRLLRADAVLRMRAEAEALERELRELSRGTAASSNGTDGAVLSHRTANTEAATVTGAALFTPRTAPTDAVSTDAAATDADILTEAHPPTDTGASLDSNPSTQPLAENIPLSASSSAPSPSATSTSVPPPSVTSTLAPPPSVTSISPQEASQTLFSHQTSQTLFSHQTSQTLFSHPSPLDAELHALGLVDQFASRRHDWGDMPVYCIDSADTRDVDDGISIEAIPGTDEHWVHVHVAHPTAFVSREHAIGRLAAVRGSTLYVPERVEHMLPTHVARLFSLSANKPVLTFSGRVNAAGELVESRVCAGQVRHVISLTPAQVSHALGLVDDELPPLQLASGKMPSLRERIFDSAHVTDDGDASHVIMSGHVISDDAGLTSTHVTQLRQLHTFAQRRLQCRLRNGSFVYGVPVPAVTVHVAAETRDDGPVDFAAARFVARDAAISLSGLQPRSERDTGLRSGLTDLVAESMLLASSIAAEWCAARGVPAIYRSTAPSSGGMTDEAFEREVAVSARAEAAAGALTWSTVARYRAYAPTVVTATEPRAHARLGLPLMSQVTSPLRRYSDMLMHWQIGAALQADGELTVPARGAATASSVSSSRGGYLDTASLDALLPSLSSQERLMMRLGRRSSLFWTAQLFMRALVSNEPAVDRTFRLVVERVHSLGHVAWGYSLPLYVHMQMPVSPDAYVSIGDEWLVRLETVQCWTSSIMVAPLRLLRRGV